MCTPKKLFKSDGQSAPKFELFNKSIFDQYLYIFLIVVHCNFTTH